MTNSIDPLLATARGWVHAQAPQDYLPKDLWNIVTEYLWSPECCALVLREIKPELKVALNEYFRPISSSIANVSCPPPFPPFLLRKLRLQPPLEQGSETTPSGSMTPVQTEEEETAQLRAYVASLFQNDFSFLNFYHWELPSLSSWEWILTPDQYKDESGRPCSIFRFLTQVGKQLTPGIGWIIKYGLFENWCFSYVPIQFHLDGSKAAPFFSLQACLHEIPRPLFFYSGVTNRSERESEAKKCMSFRLMNHSDKFEHFFPEELSRHLNTHPVTLANKQSWNETTAVHAEWMDALITAKAKKLPAPTPPEGLQLLCEDGSLHPLSAIKHVKD